MKRLISISLAVCLCFCLLIGTESRAFAYVDPGTGLLALQSAASMGAAALYFMRRRIMAFFGSKKDVTVAVPAAPKSETRKAA